MQNPNPNRRVYAKTPIGARIASYRKMNGFTTAQALADAIPGRVVSKSTIVNIEIGRKPDPTLNELLWIAHGLGITPLALLFDLATPFAAPDIEMPGDWNTYSVYGLMEYFAGTKSSGTPAAEQIEQQVREAEQVKRYSGERAIAENKEFIAKEVLDTKFDPEQLERVNAATSRREFAEKIAREMIDIIQDRGSIELPDYLFDASVTSEQAFNRLVYLSD